MCALRDAGATADPTINICGYGSPPTRGRHLYLLRRHRRPRALSHPSMLPCPHIAEQKSRHLALLDLLAAFGDPVAAVIGVDVTCKPCGPATPAPPSPPPPPRPPPPPPLPPPHRPPQPSAY